MFSDDICINKTPINLKENFFSKHLKSQDSSIFQLKDAKTDSVFSKDTKIFFKPASLHVKFEKSFIGTHYLSAKNTQTPVIKNNTNYDFVTLIVFLVYLVFVILKVSYFKRLKQITDVLFSTRYLNQVIREANIFTEQISIFLNLIYFPMISLFVYFCLQWINHKGNDFLLVFEILDFAKIFVVCLGFYIVKNLFVYLLGIVFENRKSAYDYQVNMYIFNMIIGMMIFPILTIFIYNPNILSITIALILFGLLYSYKLYRSFLIGLSNSNYSLYYLFLYLCTVEILPFFIITKLIISRL